jgi:cytochrome c556
MMHGSLAAVILGGALVLSACSSEKAETVDTSAATNADTTAESSHAHAAEGEGQALLPIMQRLGTEMTALTYALMTDDAAGVAKSSSAIAEHVPISKAELERIHGILGGEMAEFERLDTEVHEASVRLSEAATARNTDVVLTRLAEVQRGCVSCHTKFRQRLLTNRAQ